MTDTRAGIARIKSIADRPGLLPGDVPSDEDEDETHDHLAGRWSLLVDLQSKFQCAYLAWLLVAIFVPGGLVAWALRGRPENPEGVFLGAAVVFIVALTVAVYAGVWSLWVKCRQNRTFDLMKRRGEEELAREVRVKAARRAAGQDLFG